MKWDFNDLENKLNNASETLNDVENIVDKIKNDLICNGKMEEEINYFKVNNAYKNYINQYSKSYIELSEYYYGPELPYNIYIKEFRNKSKESTYLDTKEDVKELYKLFIFYGLLEYYLKTII